MKRTFVEEEAALAAIEVEREIKRQAFETDERIFDVCRTVWLADAEKLDEARDAIKMKMYLTLHKQREKVYQRVLRDCRKYAHSHNKTYTKLIRIPVPINLRPFKEQLWQYFSNRLYEDHIHFVTGGLGDPYIERCNGTRSEYHIYV